MSQLRAAAIEPRNMSSAELIEGQWWPEMTKLDTAALLSTMLWQSRGRGGGGALDIHNTSIYISRVSFDIYTTKLISNVSLIII